MRLQRLGGYACVRDGTSWEVHYVYATAPLGRCSMCMRMYRLGVLEGPSTVQGCSRFAAQDVLASQTCHMHAT
jgi:hypothetical protein